MLEDRKHVTEREIGGDIQTKGRSQTEGNDKTNEVVDLG